MTSPKTDSDTITRFTGVIHLVYKKGEPIDMGDRARENGERWETFDKVCTVEEFDKWVLYSASRGIEVHLQEAVPVDSFRPIMTSVNW